MHIAYVCADRGVAIGGHSGSSVHVQQFAAALVERGVGVTVFSAATVEDATRRAMACPVVAFGGDAMLDDLRAAMAKELRAAGRPVIRASETYDLLLNHCLFEALQRRRARIDLVYERCSLWSFAGLHFARRYGVPYFLEVNAPLTAQQQEYRDLDMAETARALEAHLLAGADRIIVMSEALVGYVHARGVSRRKVRIIPCGVSRQAVLAAARQRPRDKAAFVVGFVGSLKPWHGVENLLDAFLRLRALNAAYRLLVVGNGPLMPQVREFSAAHHLDAAVTLAGGVDHARVPDYLAQMDVAVAPYPPLPSFYFSPLKVWEYAAAGVPIVASASGELPRLFPHRSAALLHPPGNVGKIVKHIERLRQDPDLGRRLARRARAIAKRHTWDRLAARFVSLAEPAIAAARRMP